MTLAVPAGADHDHDALPDALVVEPPDAAGLMRTAGIDATHMGRDPREDPLFFASAAVAGVVAARFVGQR